MRNPGSHVYDVTVFQVGRATCDFVLLTQAYILTWLNIIKQNNNLFLLLKEYTTWTDGRHGLQFMMEGLEDPLENDHLDLAANEVFNYSYDVITYDSYSQPLESGMWTLKLTILHDYFV